MTATKTTDLAALTSVDGAADFMFIVDTSDTSMAASGTTKKVLPNNLPVSTAVQTALDAKVSGPASATANAIVRFDSTTGKLVKNSSVTISDSGQIVAAQGTITTSQPVTFSQTWNASGVSFVGMLIDVTNTASAAGSSLLDMQIGGVSAARFGKPGTHGSIHPTPTSPGLTLKSGVDTLYLSGDNGYRCSIVSTYGLAIYTGECMSVGGPANGTTPGIMDHNGLNISRRGIVYARHSGQVSSGPTVMTTCYIKFGDQTNSDPVIPFEITGNGADPSGTSNLVGGSVAIIGGAGSTGSAGNAHGGAVYLTGGRGYGTGVHGKTILAHTGSAIRGPVLVGTTSDDGVGMLQVTGAITATTGISAGPITFAVLDALTPTATLGIYRITDRGNKLAYPDGTDWRFVGDDAIIS